MPSIDELVSKHAKLIVALVKTKICIAGHEDEIRVEATKGIDAFIREAELSVVSRHEYGLAGGRVDSKYGLVAIEDKNPNGAKHLTSTSCSIGNREVVAQLKERFEDFEQHEGISKDRVFGVGTDGNYIIFCWYRGSEFLVADPAKFEYIQVERLLRAIISVGARGSSFTATALANDFGASSTAANRGVELLTKQ